MTPHTNFESMLFNPFSTKECFVDNDHDPDINFHHDASMLDTQYLMPDKFKTNFMDFSKNSLSVFLKTLFRAKEEGYVYLFMSHFAIN